MNDSSPPRSSQGSEWSHNEHTTPWTTDATTAGTPPPADSPVLRSNPNSSKHGGPGKLTKDVRLSHPGKSRMQPIALPESARVTTGVNNGHNNGGDHGLNNAQHGFPARAGFLNDAVVDGRDEQVAYEHLPAALTDDFQKQMMQLLTMNDSLSSQVTNLQDNRGVKIDDEQFRAWTGKIEELRGTVEGESRRADGLAQENSLHVSRIEALEEELRRMRMNEGDLMMSLERERNAAAKRGRKDDKVPVAPAAVVRSEGCQTKHSGALPENYKRPVLTSVGTEMAVEVRRAFLSVECQTEEPPASPRARRVIPPPEAGEMDTLMVLGELNEIRKIMESDSGDNTMSVAWSEVCQHGVMSAMSAVKQRAKVRRSEGEGEGEAKAPLASQTPLYTFVLF